MARDSKDRGGPHVRTDAEYNRQRAEAETRMAQEASRADVAAIHAELAKQYQALVDQVELRPASRRPTRGRLNSEN